MSAVRVSISNRPVFWCQLEFPNWFITLLHVEVFLWEAAILLN